MNAPTISGIPAASVEQDALYIFTPVANDVDGDPLTFSILNQPSWATLSAETGQLTGVPTNDDVGTTTGIVITVSDGTLFASLPAFDLAVINVNDAPVATDDSYSVDEAPIVSNIFDQTIVEGTNLYHHITLDGQVTDVDNTDDQITWTATGNTQLTVTIDASRVATIATPNADWNGAETITFRATDPGSAFAEDGRNL